MKKKSTYSDDFGRMLGWSSFAVDVTPKCMWGVDLLDQNRTFLEGLEPDFFNYSAEAHIAGLEGPSQQHAAMAIRLIYGHAVETLFALLGAAVQAPNCPLGWILCYKGSQLHSLVRKLNGESGFGRLYTRKRNLTDWDTLSSEINTFTLPDSEEDARVKAQFADMWARLATEFLARTTTEEYNSVKHGLRARAGGSSLTIKKRTSSEPILDSQSAFGARFFHVERLTDSVNFYAQDAMRNWAPVALKVRIELIAMSMRNVISYLQAYLGASSEGSVQYQWPEARDAIAQAWKADFIIESGTGGYEINPRGIKPLSQVDVMDVYDAPGASKGNYG